ncbi:hypothetical protein HKX69_15880 [Streptomyces argyrophyllae]|uniref:Uncharacterized protein n=1 Tax=Streptomyces argyrophylli TaxID=2726118 RepID=A0A6M4PM25_9ACTN|nr:hypothetical protein [Streptomyces argyrophyllae]QJS10796.1 hypothetical protein HKX69_15880 [Streptomyces argyrophyllae]
MRYPPTCIPLLMGPSAIAPHPMGDVLVAAMPAVPGDQSPGIAEASGRSDRAPHFGAVVFSCRAVVKRDRRLFQTILREVGVAPWQTLYCGDGSGGELAGRTL